MRLWKVKLLIQIHKAIKSEGQNLKPGLDDSKATGSSSLFYSGKDDLRAHKGKKAGNPFFSTMHSALY